MGQIPRSIERISSLLSDEIDMSDWQPTTTHQHGLTSTFSTTCLPNEQTFVEH